MPKIVDKHRFAFRNPQEIKWERIREREKEGARDRERKRERKERERTLREKMKNRAFSL